MVTEVAGRAGGQRDTTVSTCVTGSVLKRNPLHGIAEACTVVSGVYATLEYKAHLSFFLPRNTDT